jgi:shikimate dehydrogenase
MKIYGIIGYPLSHSFSKKYFTEKFLREGLTDCAYENFPLKSIDDFRALLVSHPSLHGLNVTIPYKEQILHFLHVITDLVKATGACNCIKIVEGKLTGYNTDIMGFEKSLKKRLQPNHNQALILGTGGAAKAVQYVLAKAGIGYQYVSRKKSATSISYDELNRKIISSHTLIINTTPLGMYPRVVEAPQIPYSALTAQHLLFDLIYNPDKTLFLQKGEQMGAEIQNGLEMLIIQAEENWRIWNE